MSQELWSAVDQYVTDLIVHPDAALESALADSAAAGLPSIAVSPSQGKLLMLMAMLAKARRILEIGTLGGYSTIWLARGLAEGGRVVTLEAEAKHAEIARANIRRAGLENRVEVILGPAQESLARIAGPFDLIFIDADKPSYPEYLKRALSLSRSGTLIIADNVVRKGAVADAASKDENVQGTRRFNELLGAEKRVKATVIQTVGSKGYDGLAIAVVV